MRFPALVASLLCSLALALPAHAATRAWLLPERIAVGDTTTLNVETDAGDSPDFSVLQNDFTLRGTSSSTQMSFVNGQGSTKTITAVVLEPRSAGTYTIPSFTIGNERTEPLKLTVLPSLPGSAQRGDAVYLEAELDADAPYVQQAVLYTVRLFYAIPIVDGAIDVPQAQDVTVSRVGEDRQYQQSVGGRPYNVLERRFVLQPERSGRIELAAPRFRGRAMPGGFDPFARNGNVSAMGPALALDVKPQPDTAPQPWLPAASLTIARADIGATPRAGEPFTVELTLTAQGALATQLPALELPAIPGAQVFPEPLQRNDATGEAAPTATVRRRFAVVPTAAGRLEIPELRFGYWNTRSDRADAAVLAPLVLDVAAGSAPQPATPPAAGEPVVAAPAVVRADDGALRLWQGLSAALALALAFALALLHRQSRRPRPASAAAMPAPAASPTLRRALAVGDLGAIATALCAAASPRALSPGELASRVDDPAQRAALVRLDRALWSPAIDAAEREATRNALRAAFRDGLKTGKATAVSAAAGVALPPLYPTR